MIKMIIILNKQCKIRHKLFKMLFFLYIAYETNFKVTPFELSVVIIMTLNNNN